MTEKQLAAISDRITIVLGIAIPLALTLGVSVYVVSLMSSGNFPDSQLTVFLLVAAWILIGVLCTCFLFAVRRNRLRN